MDTTETVDIDTIQHHRERLFSSTGKMYVRRPQRLVFEIVRELICNPKQVERKEREKVNSWFSSSRYS